MKSLESYLSFFQPNFMISPYPLRIIPIISSLRFPTCSRHLLKYISSAATIGRISAVWRRQVNGTPAIRHRRRRPGTALIMTAAADLSRESASPGERADGVTSAPSSFTGPHRVAPFYVHVTMRVVALLREAKEAVLIGHHRRGPDVSRKIHAVSSGTRR